MIDLPRNKKLIDYVRVIDCPARDCSGSYEVASHDLYELYVAQSQDHGDVGEFWLTCKCSNGHRFRAVLDLSMTISTELRLAMLIESDDS